MSRNVSINHPIKLHIIDLLTHKKVARFSELRPPRTETNLFNYHLNALVELGVVGKLEDGYTLQTLGFLKMGQLSGGFSSPQNGNTSTKSPHQLGWPIVMFVVQNDEGDILVQRRTTQPFIDSWSLPYGSLTPEDFSVEAASARISKSVLGVEYKNPDHAGDCYIRIYSAENQAKAKDISELVSVNLVHVFRFYTDEVELSDTITWARPHKLHQLELAPATQDIMARTFFKDPFYFEEFSVNL